MPATEFAMAFTSTPRGARLARLFVAHCLDSWGHPHTSTVNETLTLITAELCANAVQHGRVPGRDFHVRVTAEADGRRLRVEVPTPARNAGPPLPCPRTSTPSPSPAAASSSSPRSPTTGASRTARAASARPCGPPSACAVPPSRTRASHSTREPAVRQQPDAAPITLRDAKVAPQGEDVARLLCRVRRSITRRRQPGHAPAARPTAGRLGGSTP
ncbi:ATP-binding protein [Streptomyces albogriseolus]|uniref:ATP-binding protein n=1 Tax=Streptomyces albogriseolus TaxID=1887 RepID=UPI003F4A5493